MTSVSLLVQSINEREYDGGRRDAHDGSQVHATAIVLSYHVKVDFNNLAARDDTRVQEFTQVVRSSLKWVKHGAVRGFLWRRCC